MEPVTLHTARLELSPPAEADIDAIYDACQDPLIQRYTTVPSPYAREHAEGFIAKTRDWWESGSEATWAIQHEGELAGMVGLHRMSAGAGSAEIGYWMTPAFRRGGYLTEACRAVVDFGFSPDGLDLVRISWRAVAGNEGSARLARRIGFRFEGAQRQALVNGAGVRDDGWMAGLLRTDDREPQPWPVLADL
ncbi:GNAT family N-acetyltransferase [Microbacterium sp. W1N]|uniref:GNAT family N-acetyltransferase n=1 Tax=Microbacterium festucae TaxID=2977531 RepID=UPI0021C03D17|nr:GNAT family N-acetyltransferase [Microbacterium festucae]MCT9818822.1 GNAT family N-acetyltransferase [Microbacterium festucae]